MVTVDEKKYKVILGPEAFLSPAAAVMGVELPDAGEALIEGEVVSEDDAVTAIALKLGGAKNPVICPGPLLLWQWTDGVSEKSAAVKKLATACGARIIPMIDYSAKRIDPNAEINPNHPNVTIMHNNIDVCMFVGIHSHYANIALRLIRGSTNCYTIALGDYAAIEEAMISIGNIDVGKIDAIAKKLTTVKTANS